MRNHEVLLWPVSKDAQAFLYADGADAAYAAHTGNPDDKWTPRDTRDAHGQLHMPYYGPTGGEWDENTPIEEPPELVPLRADAVLVTRYDELPEE